MHLADLASYAADAGAGSATLYADPTRGPARRSSTSPAPASSPATARSRSTPARSGTQGLARFLEIATACQPRFRVYNRPIPRTCPRDEAISGRPRRHRWMRDVIVSDLPSHVKAASLLLSAFGRRCLLAVGCQPGNKYVPPPPPEVTVSPPRSPVGDELHRVHGHDQGHRDGRPSCHGSRGSSRSGSSGRAKTSRRGSSCWSSTRSRSRWRSSRRGEARGRPRPASRRPRNRRPRRWPRPSSTSTRRPINWPGSRRHRQRALIRRNAGSQEDLDKAEADRKKAEAQVEADQANLEQAQADYVTNILDRQGQRRPGRGRGPQRQDRPRLLPDRRAVRRPDQPGRLRRRQPRGRRPGRPSWPRSSSSTRSMPT